MLQRPTFVLALALSACGGGSGQDMPDAAVGPGHDAATSVDAPIPTDAPLANTPQTQPIVMSSGGTVMAAPHIVPVFFANDATMQATVETFLGQLAGSSYWTAISSEYGVGALTIAPTVIATETPPTTDTALQTLIKAHAGGTGGWPANTPNTLYAVFLPDGVTLTMQGSASCVAFDGYHSEVNNIIYALMPRCAATARFTTLQTTTIAASHEFLEAATDPHPFTAPAYNTGDDEHAIWQLAPGFELGDMCEYNHAAYQPLLGTFTVQRTWSNAAAAAGHDPCVPALATPYVQATTNLPFVTIDTGQGSLVTRGIQLAVGESKTIEVDLYSDGAAPDWTVAAYDVASKYQMQPEELTFSFDKTTGHNGDKLMLTITRVKAAGQIGVSELALQSSIDGVSASTWWALVE